MKGRSSKILAAFLCIALLVGVLAVCAAAQGATPTVVYLDGTNGDDANNGASASAAVKGLARAYELLLAVDDGVKTNASAEGVIVLCGTIDLTANFNIPASGSGLKASQTHAGLITITSAWNDEDYRDTAVMKTTKSDGLFFQAGGPTKLENINLDTGSDKSVPYFCIYGGTDFTIGNGVTVANPGTFWLCGGYCRVDTSESVSLTVLSGNVNKVSPVPYSAGHGHCTGSHNILIGGNAVVDTVLAGPIQNKSRAQTVTSTTVTVTTGATVKQYNNGGAGAVASSTLILAGGTVQSAVKSSNIQNNNSDVQISGVSGEFTLPIDSDPDKAAVMYKTLTITGNSNVTLTAAVPAATSLVVDSGSTVTLAEGDTHTYTGNGTVNYVHEHHWAEASRTSSDCTTAGRVYYECDIGSCTAEYDEALPLSHNITNGVCADCGGKDNVVYVADGGTGDGYTANTPVGTMEAAYDALFDRTDIKTDAQAAGTIVLCGTVTVGDHFNYGHEYTHAGTITYDGMNYNAVLGVYAAQKSDLTSHSDNYNGEHRYQFGGPTVLKNLTIDRGSSTTASVNLTFYTGTDLVIEETVKVINTNWVGTYVQPIAGLTDDDIDSIKLSAHRGYQPMGPENSILSFTAAGELGFDYIETDVYMTSDGELICIHDSTLDRTTNGSGNVMNMTYEQILQYRIDTAAYGYNIADADEEDLYVPTFREYLEICDQYGCFPFIEIKDGRRATLEAIVEMALEYFDAEDIVMSGGSLSHLQTSHEINQDLFIHLIWGDQSDAGYTNSINVLSQMKNSDGDIYAGIAFNITGLDNAANFNRAKSWIEKANEAGLQTCLRGADNMIQVRKMFELGIDYYPTNTTSPEKLQQLKQGTEGDYSYSSAGGGKIFVRGGYRGMTTAEDISITLLGGMYDFVAPSNGEGVTTGSYSVTIGGTAFASRLIAGETGSNGTGDRASSTVTVQDEAVVNDLYLAGDFANTESVTVNLLGGSVANMAERRSGKTGTVENLAVYIASVKALPGTVSISNTNIITGTKVLTIGGTGELNNSAAWDKLIAADGALIDLTGTYPQTLEKEGSGKFRISGQSVTFGTIADIKEDGEVVVLGTDIPCDIVGNGALTVTWYKDNEGTKGETLTGAPKAAGTYWVGVALAEGTTNNDALIHAAVAEQTVSFTIVHDLTEVKAEAPDCVNDGVLKHYTCAGCDMIFADAEGKNVLPTAVDPAAGHDLDKVDATAPNCTENGIIEHYSCSVCKKNFADAEGKNALTSTVDPAVGHKLAKVDGKDATCTEEGVAEHYNCSVCKKNFADAEGKTEKSDVSIAAGHKLSKVDGKDATATENGTKKHYACGSCGKLYADAEGKKELAKTDIVINATGNSSDTGDKALIVPALILILLSAAGMAVMAAGKKQWTR